jgi:hypothetical protein
VCALRPPPEIAAASHYHRQFGRHDLEPPTAQLDTALERSGVDSPTLPVYQLEARPGFGRSSPVDPMPVAQLREVTPRCLSCVIDGDGISGSKIISVYRMTVTFLELFVIPALPPVETRWMVLLPIVFLACLGFGRRRHMSRACVDDSGRTQRDLPRSSSVSATENRQIAFRSKKAGV